MPFKINYKLKIETVGSSLIIKLHFIDNIHSTFIIPEYKLKMYSVHLFNRYCEHGLLCQRDQQQQFYMKTLILKQKNISLNTVML